MDHRFDSHGLTTLKSDPILDENIVATLVNAQCFWHIALSLVKMEFNWIGLYLSFLIAVLFNCFSQELDNLKAELERMDKIFIEKDAKFVAISKKVST